MTPGRRGTRLALRVRTASGAFQGKLQCSVPGLPCIEFHTAIYDLRDTGMAIVHMDGPHGGPVGILAVIPRNRRKLLRNDFAFELMTLISFLGSPVNSGSELAIHDYMEEVLRTEPSATQVFAVETGELNSDASIVLSAHFEQLAAAMLDSMATRELEDESVFDAGEVAPCLPLPVACHSAAVSSGCFAV